MPKSVTVYEIFLLGVALLTSWGLSDDLLAQRKGSKEAAFGVGTILKTLDANKNGMLEPAEMSGRTREVVQQAGLDPNRPHAISAITQKLQALSGRKAGKVSRTGSSNKQSDNVGKADAVERTVSGFGIEQQAPFVPDFSPTGEEGMSVEVMNRKFSALVMARVERDLRRYDKDKNGLVDRTEQQRIRWANPSAEESDSNKDGVLTRLELAYRYKQQEDQSLAKQNKTNLSVAAVGLRGKSIAEFSRESDPTRAGFKKRRSARGNRIGNGGSQPGRGNDRKREFDYREYAKGLMKKFDKDEDGKLNKEEIKPMKRINAAADLNKDQFVDLNELVVSVARKSDDNSKTNAKYSVSATSLDSESELSQAIDSEQPEADETLNPKDVIFGGKDLNNDHQLQMSEFASEWDATKVEKFKAKDLNDDGVITEKEWTGG